jgi:hypothetical protein
MSDEKDYELTATQQKAFAQLRQAFVACKKAFVACKKAKVLLFNYYGALYGVNGRNYSHVLFHDFRTDEDCDDLLVDDLVLPTIDTSDFDLASFADEGDLYLRRR